MAQPGASQFHRFHPQVFWQLCSCAEKAPHRGAVSSSSPFRLHHHGSLRKNDRGCKMNFKLRKMAMNILYQCQFVSYDISILRRWFSLSYLGEFHDCSGVAEMGFGHLSWAGVSPRAKRKNTGWHERPGTQDDDDNGWIRDHEQLAEILIATVVFCFLFSENVFWNRL